jgi:hypothetical protein
MTTAPPSSLCDMLLHLGDVPNGINPPHSVCYHYEASRRLRRFAIAAASITRFCYNFRASFCGSARQIYEHFGRLKMKIFLRATQSSAHLTLVPMW